MLKIHRSSFKTTKFEFKIAPHPIHVCRRNIFSVEVLFQNNALHSFLNLERFFLLKKNVQILINEKINLCPPGHALWYKCINFYKHSINYVTRARMDRDTQTHTERDTHTYTHTGIHSHKDTDRHTHKRTHT